MIKLSIIVPVYNVEKYVRPCIESIFYQGLDDRCFEVIIVNDGSTDNSMGMITDIVKQHNNITIINQENQGLSTARNNGIAIAKGKYILMLDSDDLLIKNSLKPILEKTLESEADLVVADFLVMTDNDIKNIRDIPQKDFSVKEKTGEQLFLEDHSPYECFVWRTLYKRDFLITNQITFIPKIRFQDIPYTYECYLKAKKCLRVTWLLTIYRKWSGASTATFPVERAMDFSKAIAKVWELWSFQSTPAIREKIQDNMFVHFSVMTCNICHCIHNESERLCVIDFLKKQIPTLVFRNGLKQKIVTFLYKYAPHTYIRLRYLYSIIIEDRLLPYYHHTFSKPEVLFLY